MSTNNRQRPGLGLWIVIVICLLTSLSSLALSAFLIYNLRHVQTAAREGIDAALDALDTFEESGFHYEYRFDEILPFYQEIPFEQEFEFPFEGTVPFSSTVEIPFNAGILGSFAFEVPISTSVYVNTSVPVYISETLSISTSVPISLVIPVEIGPTDPQIREMIKNIREWLEQLQDTF
jgi:hypothetical protein